MVNNFQEYKSVKEQEEQRFASHKTHVSASSIMRHIRHKMGKISDQEFFEQERRESLALDV